MNPDYRDRAAQVAYETLEPVVGLARAAWSRAVLPCRRWAAGRLTLYQWGDVILTRRPRVLLPSLRWVSRLVRFAPDAVPASLVSRLCDALSLLLTETDIPSIEERLAARTDSDRLQILRRPDARAIAAELALRLRALANIDDGCLTTLDEWAMVVETDSFLVVRQVADMLRDEGDEGE
ncbi:MAG: hypothetical protein H6827_07825 [Planctomycetes bacterium]|nr:hypothetical protein [Planctomycetota bacterium]